MICGCSSRISSATARGSIHFSASSPLLERPMLMRSMTFAALSSPSASTSTFRRNSSTPTPTEVWLSTVEEKSERMALTSSRETYLRCAIAAPTRCTSLAPMCFKTWAASCSPSVRSRMAARSVPVRFSAPFPARSLIGGHPGAHDLRDALRVLIDERARVRDLLLVALRRHHGRRPGRSGCGGGGPRLHGYRRRRGMERGPRRSDEAAHEGAQHGKRQDDEHDEAGCELRQLREQRPLPEGHLLEWRVARLRLVLERGIQDVHAVAALRIEADRVLDQLRDAIELSLRQRVLVRLAVLVDRAHVV